MGNHRIVKVKRRIPAGGINPNVGKPYHNMEEKLKELFDFFDRAFCEVPISIRDRTETLFEKYSINPILIVGFVHSFSDIDMDIKIMNDELFNTFKNPVVEIDSMVDKDSFDDDEIHVNKVLKLIMSESTES